jgi:prolipoprotein diacylglyceryltransferase
VSLDRWPRLYVELGGRRLHAFHVAGGVGVTAGTLLGLAVAAATGRSLLVVALLAPTSVTVLLGLARLAVLLTGREVLVAYQHLAAILGACAAVLAWSGRPVLGHLDLVVIGYGTTLAVGRIGCLLVGCCHGRPASTGVRYSAAHADAGFPAALVGVPLAPVQLIEAGGALCAVTVAVALTLLVSPPAAVAAFVVLYALLRLVLEPYRGDAGRLHVAGLSEAQWWSVAALGAVLALTGARVAGAPAGVVVGVATAVLVAVLARRWAGPGRLTARQVIALAEAVRLRPAGTAPVSLPGGLLVSSAALQDRVALHTVSRAGRPLQPAESAALAELMALLNGRTAGWQRLTASGVLQVLVPGSPD